MLSRTFRCVTAVAGFATAAAAQGTALPPIRPLAKAKAASTELLGAVSQVRALPDGRVLVNDNLGRKVVLFDAALSSSSVVADTTSATANAYSSRAAGLIQYKGDSTLFVDPVSMSMLLIDGKGQITPRVMSVPRPNDAIALIGGPNGTPAFDAQGRLVYRGAPAIRMRPAAANDKSSASGPTFGMPEIPDSTAVVRIDLATRKLDTVTFVKTPKLNMSITQNANGGMSMSSITNPMPIVDDWAVTSDGRVAVLRGQEYRVDWYDADGKFAASNKVPFAWRHLDDSMKVAFIDSTKKAMEVLRQQALARQQAGGGTGPLVVGPGGGGEPAMGGGMFIMRAETSAGGDRSPARPQGDANGRGGTNTPPTLPPLQFVNPSELPDYAPAFTAGATRGDGEGNLWVRTTNTVNGGSVYDVINAKGELTDRVLFPPGRVIAGFGKGVVYMGVREGAGGTRLEVAAIRQATP